MRRERFRGRRRWRREVEGGVVRGGGADDGLSAVAEKSTGEERARCALELWMRFHGNCRFPNSRLNGLPMPDFEREREE